VSEERCMVRSMEGGGGGGDESVWAGQGMPGTNVPGQRGKGAYVERVRVMDTRDI
jgi:hypothetical protein